MVISILDDGIEKDHPDLWANYVSCLGIRTAAVSRRTQLASLLLILLPYLLHRTLWPAMTSMTTIQTPSPATHPTMRTGEPGARYRVFLGPAEMPWRMGQMSASSLLWNQTWNPLRWGSVCHS